jgi:hypothetical protein
MNILTRLTKMESSLKVTDDLCRCPDALALAATPYFRTCYRCERPIDISTWQHWQTCYPTEKTNYFAFGLKRDDKQELADKENNYFSDEVTKILQLLEIKKGE